MAPGPDGRSPYRLATALDREDVAELLSGYGARDDRTAVDRLLGACRHGDRETATRLMAEHPELSRELTAEEAAAIVTAAEAGDAVAIGLMLDVGIPIETHNEGHGATALHVAAHSGSVETVGRAERTSRPATACSTPTRSGGRPSAAASSPQTRPIPTGMRSCVRSSTPELRPTGSSSRPERSANPVPR